MRFELFRGHDGQTRFRLKGGNNEVVAQSEGYQNPQDALDTIRAIRLGAQDADFLDLTGSTD